MSVNNEFDVRAEKAIPAEVHMISGCCMQTLSDESNVGRFRLPDKQGRTGGAGTAALLQVLYASRNSGGDVDMTWTKLLRLMRQNLRSKGYDQIPQLTSSRLININEPLLFVNPSHPFGVKRAVLIGINYTGQEGALSGCHADVRNMKAYLENVHLFKSENVTILMDDGSHTKPTKRNIMNAYRSLVRKTNPGDTVFCHYSGHVGQVKDKYGDEAVGFGKTLIPVDFQRNGHILDDDLLLELITPMPSGALVTCLMDCCHSGTVMDLPYRFTADGDVSAGMQRNGSMNFNALQSGRPVCCTLTECKLH